MPCEAAERSTLAINLRWWRLNFHIKIHGVSRNDLWVCGSNVAQQNCIRAPKIEALMPMGELIPAICCAAPTIIYRVCFKLIYVAWSPKQTLKHQVWWQPQWLRSRRYLILAAVFFEFSLTKSFLSSVKMIEQKQGFWEVVLVGSCFILHVTSPLSYFENGMYGKRENLLGKLEKGGLWFKCHWWAALCLVGQSPGGSHETRYRGCGRFIAVGDIYIWVFKMLLYKLVVRMYEICFKKWVAFPKPAAIFWGVFNSKAPPFSDSGGALKFDTL